MKVGEDLGGKLVFRQSSELKMAWHLIEVLRKGM